MDPNNNDNIIPTKVTIFDILQTDILSNYIFGQYCTGKTISTFAIVLEGYYYNNSSTTNSNNSNDDDYDEQKQLSILNNNNNNKRKRIDDNNNNNNGNDNDGTITIEATTIASSSTTEPIHNNHHYESTSILREPLLTRYEHILTLIRQRREKYAKPSIVNDNHTDNNNTTQTTTNATLKKDKNEDDADTGDANTINKTDSDYVKCEVEKVIEYIQSKIRETLKVQFSTSDSTSKTNDDTTGTTKNGTSSKRVTPLDIIKERMKLLSGWCAILDYFELVPMDETITTFSPTYLKVDVHYNTSALIVWVGIMKTRWGNITGAILTCTTTSPLPTRLYTTNYRYNEPYSTWSVAALQYWYNIFDEQKVYFVGGDELEIDDMIEQQMVPYGSLSTTRDHIDGYKYIYKNKSKTPIDHIVYNRNDNELTDLFEKFTLLPENERWSDNPTIVFDVCTPSMKRPGDHTKFKLYWDPAEAEYEEEFFDDDHSNRNYYNSVWERNIYLLPSYVIRIMDRLQHLKPKPYQHTFLSYQTCFDDSDEDPDELYDWENHKDYDDEYYDDDNDDDDDDDDDDDNDENHRHEHAIYITHYLDDSENISSNDNNDDDNEHNNNNNIDNDDDDDDDDDDENDNDDNDEDDDDDDDNDD